MITKAEKWCPFRREEGGKGNQKRGSNSDQRIAMFKKKWRK